MKCFKQMLLLMHIPQATNAPGDLCQQLLKHLFQETAPLHHHPGPSQPNGGLGLSGRHRAPEGTGREEDEGLEDCWLSPRVVVHDHGGVGRPHSSLGMRYVCTRRETHVGLLAGTAAPRTAGMCRKAGFCSRTLQIRVSQLCFPPRLSICFSTVSLSLAFPASEQKVCSGNAKVQLDKNEKKKSHHLSLCSS